MPATPVLALAGRDGFRAPAAHAHALPGPRGWPVLGNSAQLQARAPHATLESWARRFGPLFRMRFGPMRAIGVAEPGLIEQLLRHRPEALSRSPRVSRLIEDTGLSGVFSAEGEAWRRQRRLVMRALTPEVIRDFFPVIALMTRRLQQRWTAATRRGDDPDVLRDLKCFSVDLTTWLTAGIDLDTLSHDASGLQADIDLWFQTIGRRLTAALPYWKLLRFDIDRRSDAAIARLHARIDRLVEEARETLAREPALRLRPRNIVQALVVARDEAGSGFTDEDVRGNVAVMFFAGEDTTANTIGWLMSHLAESPRASQSLREEVDAVRGGQPAIGSFADLERLPYLEAAVQESMRLRPIAPVIGLHAQVDLDLAGARIPKGHLIFLLPRICATQEDRYARPGEFRPERWLEDGGGTDAGRSMFPFGGGPRHCPGRYLALVEIKMVMAMVSANFSLHLRKPAAQIAEHCGLTMVPDALPLQLRCREHGVAPR